MAPKDCAVRWYFSIISLSHGVSPLLSGQRLLLASRRSSPVQIMGAVLSARLERKASPFGVWAKDRDQHFGAFNEIDYFDFGGDIKSNNPNYQACQQ